MATRIDDTGRFPTIDYGGSETLPPHGVTAGPSYGTRAGPSSRLHPSASAGPYVTAPHSQRQVKCRPHEHAMLPASIRPAANRHPTRAPDGRTPSKTPRHCPRGRPCFGRCFGGFWLVRSGRGGWAFPLIPCGWSGRLVRQVKSGRGRQWCSDACRMKSYQAHNRLRRN
jgi:hypothetical protein